MFLGWGSESGSEYDLDEAVVNVELKSVPFDATAAFRSPSWGLKVYFQRFPQAHLDNLYLAVTFVLLAVAILCVWRQGACPLPVCEAATGVHLREMMIEPGPGPGPGKLEEEDTSSSTVVTVLHFPLTSAWCWYDCWAQPRSTITTCTFYFIHVAHWNLIDILHWLGVASRSSPSNIYTLQQCPCLNNIITFFESYSSPLLCLSSACGKICRSASDKMLTESSWPQTCESQVLICAKLKYFVDISDLWQGLIIKQQLEQVRLGTWVLSTFCHTLHIWSIQILYLSDPSNWEQRAGVEIGVPGALKVCLYQILCESVQSVKTGGSTEFYLGGAFTTQEWHSNPKETGEINRL